MTINMIQLPHGTAALHPPLCDKEKEIVVMLDMLTEDELELARDYVSKMYRRHVN